MILCADTPIPSFDSIWQNLVGEITFPPNISFDFTIPPLPSLLNPIFSDISHFALELSNIAQELQSYQFLQTIYQFIEPLAEVIGSVISSLIPSIPVINLNLIDLLSLDPTALYDAVKEAIENLTFPSFPTIPSPLFSGLSVPSFEILLNVKLMLKDYINTLMNIIPDLVQQVSDILTLGLSELVVPQLPSLSEIMEQIANLVEWPDFDINFPSFPPIEFLKGFSISELLSQITVPGFPSFSIPDPLFPNYSNIEQELLEGLNILYQEMIAYPMQVIMDFLNDFLSMLGFSFPTLCITI